MNALHKREKMHKPIRAVLGHGANKVRQYREENKYHREDSIKIISHYKRVIQIKFDRKTSENMPKMYKAP